MTVNLKTFLDFIHTLPDTRGYEATYNRTVTVSDYENNSELTVVEVKIVDTETALDLTDLMRDFENYCKTKKNE